MKIFKIVPTFHPENGKTTNLIPEIIKLVAFEK